MTILSVRHIDCRYGAHTAVRDLSFHIRRGEIVSLLGPSGCGKTTVLRAIAGFEPLTSGEIHLDGRCVSRPAHTLPPEQRHIGMVFQDLALFPHLTVARNVAFGLRGLDRAAREAAVTQVLDVVGLSGYERRYPHELSGGQQQRVALARALAPKPAVLLLDEPFSSMDVELRERLSVEVRDILKEQGITAVLVTHDQHEAFAMCSRVGVMHEGRLLQWDTPYNLYHEPAERFVADFIGQGRLIPGRLLSNDTIETCAGIIRGNRAFIWPAGTAVDVLIRPDDVVYDPQGPLQAEVIDRAFKGAEMLYTLRIADNGILLSLLPSHLDHAIGTCIPIRIAADHLVAFPRN